MAGPAPFQSEKEQHVGAPARDARSTAPLRVPLPARAPIPTSIDQPGARSPFTLVPYATLRVRSRYECEEMAELAANSATFARHQAKLAENRVEVDYNIAKLPADAGGGRTDLPANGKTYQITIDPETIRPNWHVFEVFLHEHGHVAERVRIVFEGAREGKYYLEFMNRVQLELGLRRSPDSHEDAKPKRRR